MRSSLGLNTASSQKPSSLSGKNLEDKAHLAEAPLPPLLPSTLTQKATISLHYGLTAVSGVQRNTEYKEGWSVY